METFLVVTTRKAKQVLLDPVDRGQGCSEHPGNLGQPPPQTVPGTQNITGAQLQSPVLQQGAAGLTFSPGRVALVFGHCPLRRAELLCCAPGHLPETEGVHTCCLLEAHRQNRKCWGDLPTCVNFELCRRNRTISLTFAINHYLFALLLLREYFHMHSRFIPFYVHGFPCLNTWEIAAQAVEVQIQIPRQLSEGLSVPRPCPGWVTCSHLLLHTHVQKLSAFLTYRKFGHWPTFS